MVLPKNVRHIVGHFIMMKVMAKEVKTKKQSG